MATKRGYDAICERGNDATTELGNDATAELSDKPNYLNRIPNEIIFELLQYFEIIELYRIRCLSRTMNSRVNGYIVSLKSFKLSGLHPYERFSGFEEHRHRELFNQDGCPCVERRTIPTKQELVSLEFDTVEYREIQIFFNQYFPLLNVNQLKVRCHMNEDTAKLLNFLPSNALQSLAIFDDSRDEDLGINLILQHHWESLRNVALIHFAYDVNKLSFNIEMLRELYLTSNYTNFGPPASTFSNLKRLEIYFRKTDLSLCTFPQLEYLMLDFVSSISLPDSLPKLKELGAFPIKTQILRHGKKLLPGNFPRLQPLIVLHYFNNEIAANLAFNWESFPVVLSNEIILMLTNVNNNEDNSDDWTEFGTSVSLENILKLKVLKKVRLLGFAGSQSDCWDSASQPNLFSVWLTKASAFIDSLHNVSHIQIEDCPPMKLLLCLKHKWEKTLDLRFFHEIDLNLDSKEQVLLEKKLNDLFGEKLNVRIQLHTYTSKVDGSIWSRFFNIF